jgi:hypothetical protein
MRCIILIVLAAIGLAVPGPRIAFATGNLEVTETNTTSIARKDTFGENDVVKLPEGGKITVLDNATGKTAVCAGPYSGPIGKCPGEKKCGLISRLLGRCGATDPQSPGGTRGVRP